MVARERRERVERGEAPDPPRTCMECRNRTRNERHNREASELIASALRREAPEDLRRLLEERLEEIRSDEALAE